MKSQAVVFRELCVSLLLSVVTTPAFAQATGGLQKAKGFLQSIEQNLTTFIPIIAVISGLILVVCYWFRIVEKETFGRWIVGLIIAGSIGEIVAMFLS
ncbi:TrbC/VirB2 family protein [Xanthomonas albilineans]|uniref:Probable conjugal transfer protein n=1 Tax=Xanthomonas albilineans (strain GPE PC73 / CFBP 7063) TaxID=380358 RepID=D6CKB9_XANAP|nr:TrbC/VirB2 family protein [Xanthomonas albilineans]CAZ15908.1 probable conjugal transfer protein [Xanthomonas albilineans]